MIYKVTIVGVPIGQKAAVKVAYTVQAANKQDVILGLSKRYDDI